MKRLAIWWFKKSGWRFVGSLPKRKLKIVMLAGPHTSYRDFVFAVAIRELTRYQALIGVSANTWKWWNSWLLRSTGGLKVPADNDPQAQEILINRLKSKKRSTIVLTFNLKGDLSPKGSDFFYRVVQSSDAELVLVAFDHRRKVVKFHSAFKLSGHKERDLSYIRSYFHNYYSFYNREIARP